MGLGLRPQYTSRNGNLALERVFGTVHDRGLGWAEPSNLPSDAKLPMPVRGFSPSRASNNDELAIALTGWFAMPNAINMLNIKPRRRKCSADGLL